MKKLLIFLPIVLLSACGWNTKNTNSENVSKNSSNQEQIVKNAQIQNKQEQNSKETVDQSQNTKQNINKEDNNQKSKELEIYKKEYSEKITKLENLWKDKMSKLQVLANANCPWVCNLDMKDKLSKTELKIAQDCNKVCIAKQNQAKKELKKIEEQLKKEKQAYPEKCFQDAKQNYERQAKFRKQEKQQLPEWFKQPSKEEIVQSDAERCILIYGWTNYDCEKIKKYTKPYQKCKRLIQLQQDMQFIKSWKYRSFDDYLREKNR